MNIKNDQRYYFPILITFLISFLIFYLFVLLQSLVAEFSSDSTFLPVYLPAGVLFVAILVGGVPGALGVFLALICNVIIQNPDISVPLIVGLITFSISVQYLVVKSFSYLLQVGPNLERLTYMKTVGIALAFSVSHSLNHHFNLVMIKGRTTGWAESKLAVSTFFGVFSILFFLLIASKIKNHFFSRNREISL